MDKSSQEIATVNTKAEYGTAKKRLNPTKRITYLATLVAASLAFKLLGQVLTFGGSKITIVYIPWILSALVMGPIGGMTVCFATDVIGTLILPTAGLPLPLLVVSNALFGLIMGLAFKIPKLNLRLKTLIGTAVVICVCTLGLSTYALADFYNIPFWVQFVKRISQAVMVAVNAAATVFLFPTVKKLGLIDKT